MKRLIIGLLAALILLVGLTSTALAINSTFRTIAGIGSVRFTNEVFVERISVFGPFEVEVSLSANDSVEEDAPYLVLLYLEGQETGASKVKWSLEEIPGTPKLITFPNLDLVGITRMTVEVLRQSQPGTD